MVRMRQSFLSPIYAKAYRIHMLRPLIRWMLERTEGGTMHSRTWRQIMLDYERAPRSFPCCYPASIPRGTLGQARLRLEPG